MKTYLPICILILMAILVACDAPPAATSPNDGATSPTSAPINPNLDPTPTREGDTGTIPSDTTVAGFSAQLNGAGFNNEIVGEGWLSCNQGNYQLTNSSLQSIILINFPSGVPTGRTFEVGKVVSARVQFDANTVYSSQAIGSFTLQSLATAAGGSVRGTFDFTVANTDGDTLSVNGTFDFSATDDMLC